MRETAAQKKARISLLLGDYDAKSREANKLAKEVDALKEQIRALDLTPGPYGDWIFGVGTPRNNVDNAAVRDHYREAGMELPRKLSEAPIIVNPKAGK